MPTSLFKKIVLKSPRPTTVILQLVDRLLVRPEKIIMDLLEQVGSLIFSVDFIILDFDADLKVPFILEHLFFVTRCTLTDVANTKLKLIAHNKFKVFYFYNAMKCLSIYEDWYAITEIDFELELIHVMCKDLLEIVLVKRDIFGDENAKDMV